MCSTNTRLYFFQFRINFVVLNKSAAYMSVPTIAIPTENLLRLGLKNTENLHYQSTPEDLVQDTLRIGEGVLNDTGALVIRTGAFTGRSPRDKFTVKDDITADSVYWNEFNLPLSTIHLDVILKKVMSYVESLPELWVRDCFACADPRYRIRVRVVNEKPWNSLFAYNM